MADRTGSLKICFRSSRLLNDRDNLVWNFKKGECVAKGKMLLAGALFFYAHGHPEGICPQGWLASGAVSRGGDKTFPARWGRFKRDRQGGGYG